MSDTLSDWARDIFIFAMLVKHEPRSCSSSVSHLRRFQKHILAFSCNTRVFVTSRPPYCFLFQNEQAQTKHRPTRSTSTTSRSVYLSGSTQCILVFVGFFVNSWVKGNITAIFLSFFLSCSTNFSNICLFLQHRQPSFMRIIPLAGKYFFKHICKEVLLLRRRNWCLQHILACYR